MLSSLHIQNIVLIEQCVIDFQNGLAALTGETGAGKSILLDAFSLALGARGDANLVRQDTDKGIVIASFHLDEALKKNISKKFSESFDDLNIDISDELILRRIQHSDGKSRAFINDTPVSMKLLRALGQQLVEIHGQHDDRALVEAETHRKLLDIYGGLDELRQGVKKAYRDYKKAQKALAAHKVRLEEQEKEREYTMHAAEELGKLGAEAGEEEALSIKRQAFMSAERMKDDLQEALAALGGHSSPTPAISSILRKLERKNTENDPVLTPIVEALNSALLQIEEARENVEHALYTNGYSEAELENVEERLFALRAAARKYSCQVDDLQTLQEQFEQGVLDLHEGGKELQRLEDLEKTSFDNFKKQALLLSEKRTIKAQELTKAIAQELPPLKLEHAIFEVRVTQEDAEEGGAHGIDRVEFWAQTNPGTKPGPLMKIASGGELSRFMLALKVVLADKGSAPTLIFDEIDTGVGGAVADAMGSRLARLGKHVQVVCVTHAPQVAAAAHHHFYISKKKSSDGNSLVTSLHYMDENERLEEIARMLSGQDVTKEARAAAKSLLSQEG